MEDGINAEFYKYAGNKFYNRLIKFFSNIYKMHQYNMNGRELALS
jgi:hypothetical protein